MDASSREARCFRVERGHCRSPAIASDPGVALSSSSVLIREKERRDKKKTIALEPCRHEGIVLNSWPQADLPVRSSHTSLARVLQCHPITRPPAVQDSGAHGTNGYGVTDMPPRRDGGVQTRGQRRGKIGKYRIREIQEGERKRERERELTMSHTNYSILFYMLNPFSLRERISIWAHSLERADKAAPQVSGSSVCFSLAFRRMGSWPAWWCATS